MKEKKGLWERLSDSVDLSGETVTGLPLVEIAGQRRVLIEHHLGVCEYGRDLIRIKVCYGSICIIGAGLSLCHMTASNLVVTGKIYSISLEGNC